MQFGARGELILEASTRQHDVHRDSCRFMNEGQHSAMFDEHGVVEPQPKASRRESFDQRLVRQLRRHARGDVHISRQSGHTINDGGLSGEEIPLDMDGSQSRPEVCEQISDG